jgi:DnaK suppressor protein
MTAAQNKEIKDIIVEQIKHLEQEIELLKEKTKPIPPDCSLGRLTRLEAISQQQVHEHALRASEIRLNKLNFILRKVDSENFGICAQCEVEIPFERLKIIPESTICVDCANKNG